MRPIWKSHSRSGLESSQDVSLFRNEYIVMQYITYLCK
jgi:hypothetical protein